jgi:hypothetical protein
LVGEILDHPLIHGDGFVRLPLFAVALGKPEEGGGRDCPPVVVSVDDGLIRLNGGVEVVIGFFFEQALLKRFVYYLASAPSFYTTDGGATVKIPWLTYEPTLGASRTNWIPAEARYNGVTNYALEAAAAGNSTNHRPLVRFVPGGIRGWRR